MTKRKQFNMFRQDQGSDALVWRTYWPIFKVGKYAFEMAMLKDDLHGYRVPGSLRIGKEAICGCSN